MASGKKAKIGVDSQAGETLGKLVGKVLGYAKKVVGEILAKDDVETQDPFNEFMTESKKSKKDKIKTGAADEEMDEESDDEDESNSDQELLPSYQLLLSLLSLLMKTESLKCKKLT